METSTPMPTELRRRTLLNNANDSNCASPLRRSMNISIVNNPLMEVSNDDEERADRRSQLQIQKRLSVALTKSVNLSESFINEQFVMYTHLFTENKITVKNAWKLQIIDILRPLCQKSGQDVLQVASTSIDISAKVYGIRVDDVHSEGLKLASNMARVSEDAVHPDNDNEDNSEGQEEEAGAAKRKMKKKKKKKTNTGVKTTVTKNTKGNIAKLPKLEPTDFTTRVNADTGTIDNLFTNILKESSSSFILLDKSKKLLEMSDSIAKRDHRIPLKNVPLPDKQSSINSKLHDFILDQWDPDQEGNLFNGDKSMLCQIQPVVFDDNGFPIPELDGSVHDCFENNDADVDMDDNDDITEKNTERMAPEFRGTIAHVIDFRPLESSLLSSEYSFNSVVTNSNGKYIDQIWAGPSHWKLKCLKRSVPKFSGQKALITEKIKRPRKKDQPEPIEFDEEDDQEINFSKKLVAKKRPTVDIDKLTLPLMDQSCVRILMEIKELLLKPGVCPVEKKDKSATDAEDYDVNPYNYENPNDSLYCSQSQPNDNDNGDADDVMAEDDHHHDAGGLADNLVDNPEMVPNTYIQYALKAKQMDMKKLKKAIWLRLTNSASINSETQQNVEVIVQNFSDLYKSLPEILGQKENQELSSSLAFVALLHLCNEQNLKLIQLPGYKDCQIMGPQAYSKKNDCT